MSSGLFRFGISSAHRQPFNSLAEAAIALSRDALKNAAMGRSPASPSLSTTIVVIASVLALAAGAALPIMLMNAGSESPAGSTTSDADIALVQRFYAAVNQQLRTGDPSAFVDVVAPDLLEHHELPDLESGRGGLIRRVSALRATFPSLQLTARDVRPEGVDIVASVSVDGASNGSFLGLSLGQSQSVWGTQDRFRIAGGMIVERWESPASPTLFRAISEGRFTVEGNRWQRGELVRRTYDARAQVEGEHAAGPLLLVCEEGRLTMMVDEPAKSPAFLVHRPPAGGRSTSESIEPGDRATLVPGDAFIVPEGAIFSSKNDGDTPVSVLVVGALPDPVSGPESIRPTYQARADGVAYQTVAWGLATQLPSDLTIHVGQMTLTTGSDIPEHPVATLELLYVESGMLDFSSGERPAWVRHGAGAASVGENAGTLRSGDGAVVPPGSDVTYRCGGPASCTAFLVTIEAKPRDAP